MKLKKYATENCIPKIGGSTWETLNELKLVFIVVYLNFLRQRFYVSVASFRIGIGIGIEYDGQVIPQSTVIHSVAV